MPPTLSQSITLSEQDSELAGELLLLTAELGDNYENCDD